MGALASLRLAGASAGRPPLQYDGEARKLVEQARRLISASFAAEGLPSPLTEVPPSEAQAANAVAGEQRQDFTPLPKAWCEICHGFNGVPSGPDLWCPRCKHIVATFNIDIEGAPQDVPLVVPPPKNDGASCKCEGDYRCGSCEMREALEASVAAEHRRNPTDADFDVLIEEYGLADAQYEIAWRNLEMPDRERQKFRTTRDQKREALRTAIAQLRERSERPQNSLSGTAPRNER